jgi:hypothetical protein
LLAWLDANPATTIPALRRQRFTLRLIADTERDGRIAVDTRSGTITMTAR